MIIRRGCCLFHVATETLAQAAFSEPAFHLSMSPAMDMSLQQTVPSKSSNGDFVPGTPAMAPLTRSNLQSVSGPSSGSASSGSSVSSGYTLNYKRLAYASSATSASDQLLDVYFHCCTCNLQQPLSKMRVRGLQKICAPDVNNYAALANRWRSNKKLKLWWNNKTLTEKTQWYRDEQNHCAGSKRDFSTVGYEEGQSQKAKQTRLAKLDHIPLAVYIRHKFCEGTQKAQAIQMFEEYVKENPSLCVYENKQWHVPDYSGITTSVGESNSSGYHVSRGAGDLKDPAALSALVQEGTRLVCMVAAADTRASIALVPAPLADALHITQNPADAASAIAMSTMMRDEITKEVLDPAVCIVTIRFYIEHVQNNGYFMFRFTIVSKPSLLVSKRFGLSACAHRVYDVNNHTS